MWFKCNECKHRVWFSRYGDPTTSTGCCPVCGYKNYTITNDDNEEV